MNSQVFSVQERRINNLGQIRYVGIYDAALDYGPQFEYGLPLVGDLLFLDHRRWVVRQRVWELVHPNSVSGMAGIPGKVTLIVEGHPSPYADEDESWIVPEDVD